MSYELNVADTRGNHLFRVVFQASKLFEKEKESIRALQNAFPDHQLQLTLWSTVGRTQPGELDGILKREYKISGNPNDQNSWVANG